MQRYGPELNAVCELLSVPNRVDLSTTVPSGSRCRSHASRSSRHTTAVVRPIKTGSAVLDLNY
jgi:hypothetical protein